MTVAMVIMMVILMTKMAKNIQVKIEWSLSISGQDGEDKDEDVIMGLGKHDMREKFQGADPPPHQFGNGLLSTKVGLISKKITILGDRE